MEFGEKRKIRAITWFKVI